MTPTPLVNKRKHLTNPPPPSTANVICVWPLSVHEGCYGISETAGSVASTVSSASTEPWFCEACRAELDGPPICELCPIIGGVYKQTDVGRWVHLVCALYVPGVAFGDPENMTKVHTLDLFNLSKYNSILEEFYSLLKIKSKSPKVFENASIHFEGNVVVYKFY